ncbi:hypothetical protein ACWGCW_09245 [Streptomyces sp. NPDC054933]
MKNAMVARLLDVVLATGLLTVPVSSSADTKRTGSRTPHSRIAVGPQYDTTHVHLTPGTLVRAPSSEGSGVHGSRPHRPGVRAVRQRARGQAAVRRSVRTSRA